MEVRVDGSPSTFLRRPISINFVDRDSNELWLLVAAIGDGTRRLATLQKGDTLNCVLPLGNGFTMPSQPSQKVLLVGGGVGVAPLLYFGQQIKAAGGEPTFLLGARTAADRLGLDLFKAVARYAKAEDIECEVSLENKMACGVGACLCCVEKTTEGNVCVCKEGPVLNINKLSWQI